MPTTMSQWHSQAVAGRPLRRPVRRLAQCCGPLPADPAGGFPHEPQQVEEAACRACGGVKSGSFEWSCLLYDVCVFAWGVVVVVFVSVPPWVVMESCMGVSLCVCICLGGVECAFDGVLMLGFESALACSDTCNLE